MAGTLVILYGGDPDVDAWLDGVSEAVLSRRLSAGRGRVHSRRSFLKGVGVAGASAVPSSAPASGTPA